MKTVTVIRDYNYRAKAKVYVAYKCGETYRRVPEAHARALVKAGAGEINDDQSVDGA